MSKVLRLLVLLTAVMLLTTAAPSADLLEDFSAILTSYQEVPTLSTTGVGRFHARIVPEGISYQLSYSGLEGGSVGAAHIHLGARGIAGGVIAFLCGGTKQACPDSGTISGTITPADVVGPMNQGI